MGSVRCGELDGVVHGRLRSLDLPDRGDSACVRVPG